jgi:succinate dehydrogenase/fumarate reductase flavoprotein subunit
MYISLHSFHSSHFPLKKYGKEYDIFGDAVILTSGGYFSHLQLFSILIYRRYAADREGLLKEYAPSVAQLPTTNGDFAVGDGVKLAADIGAELVDMSQVCSLHVTL